jgi:steroid delta-isomerase-like uncharacterized protein
MATTEENRERFIRLVTEAVPTGDFEYMAEVFDPDVVLPAKNLPGGKHGLAGLIEGMRGYEKAVKYHSITVEDSIAAGEKVAARLTVRGQHIGEFLGIPGTGRDFSIEEIALVEFRDGKIVKYDRVADLLSMQQQLSGARSSEPAHSH